MSQSPETPSHQESVNPHETALFAAEIGDEAPQTDLHGLTPNEALSQLDQFLNHEFVSGTEAVRIVHGRGSGRLRDAVHRFLKTHELVARYRDAHTPGQQGGVTVAVLHRK